MSFNRKHHDNKRRNLVARDDFNRGGPHGKTEKAKRTALKSQLSKADIIEDWEEFEEDWGYDNDE